MAVDSVIKFVLKQFAKRSARKTGVAKLLNETDPIVQSNARNIEIHLKNMGYDPSQMSTDDILKAMNYHRAMMNQHLKQQFKGLGLSKGVDDLAKKKDPFRGWTPKIVKSPHAGGIEGVKQRMDKIKGLSDELKKLEDERFALYGKKPLTEAEIKERILRENKEAAERLRKKKEDPEDFFASGGIARVGFAGGLLARLYKGAKGLQHGAIERKLRKKYIETGMDKFKAYDKSMNEATNIVNQKKLKIVENKMNEVNVNSDDYVDLIDEHIRLTDRETYKDIKRWKNTRPDLADKTRALHFPHWAKARYGEDYHGVFQRRQALALKEQSDEINKMYPDTDGGIQDLQQRMVDEIDDMNKANIDEIIEGRKKNASGGIAGELHLNQGGRIGYATGTKKLGEGQYNPVGKGNWLLNMPEIDPRINPKWLKKKKRKGLAEILGV